MAPRTGSFCPQHQPPQQRRANRCSEASQGVSKGSRGPTMETLWLSQAFSCPEAYAPPPPGKAPTQTLPGKPGATVGPTARGETVHNSSVISQLVSGSGPGKGACFSSSLQQRPLIPPQASARWEAARPQTQFPLRLLWPRRPFTHTPKAAATPKPSHIRLALGAAPLDFGGGGTLP